MANPILEKIQDLATKIHHLKQHHAKQTSHFEQKILQTLHKEDAFSYDLDTLLGGIQYVIQTMRSTDEPARKICATWKGAIDENKTKKGMKIPKNTIKEAA